MHDVNLINNIYSADELKLLYPESDIPAELAFLKSDKTSSDFQAILVDAFAPIEA